jgi:hypothetical protein
MKNFISQLKKTSTTKLIFSLILIINQFIVLSQTKYKKDQLVNLYGTDATLLIREKSTNKIVKNGIVEFIENDEKEEIKIESGYIVYWNTWFSNDAGWYLRDRSEYSKRIQTKRVEFAEPEKNGWVQAFETNYDENGKENGVYRAWWDYQKVLRSERKMCDGVTCTQTIRSFYPSGEIYEIKEVDQDENKGFVTIFKQTCFDINGKVINCDAINWTEITKKFFGN